MDDSTLGPISPILLERDGELAVIDEALARLTAGQGGVVVIIEGPAGIGKTTLAAALGSRAREREFAVNAARGSEMEREFGFGIVRQLLGRAVREHDDLFAGAAALARPVFASAVGHELESTAGEGTLYGLFWLVADMAESGPVALVIDDAHWADAASLRFVEYLGRRLAGLPALVVLTARPHEPGAEADIVRRLTVELDPIVLRLAPLSGAASRSRVESRLGNDLSPELADAAYRATGGNPFLLDELIAALAGAGGGALTADAVSAMGPDRIAANVSARARHLGPEADAVLNAAAVLDAAMVADVAALAGVDTDRAGTIADGLIAAAILTYDGEARFAHPLLRTAVYNAIPARSREEAHAAAAELLAMREADPERVAAHLLLCEPRRSPQVVARLCSAADQALARGAAESAVAYLRRALVEIPDDPDRGELLFRLGRAAVTLRDPASIEHLQAAAELAADPARALTITIQLGEVLSLAGLWDRAVDIVERGLERFRGQELAGVFDLEAVAAASRGYDPARVADYDRELPRLLDLVDGRSDPASSMLRWTLACLGAFRDMPRDRVLELIAPDRAQWGARRDGRDSQMIAQAAWALLAIDALDELGPLTTGWREEGAAHGSVLATLAGRGFSACANQRRGRLDAAEADVRIALDLAAQNDLSLMVLTTLVHICGDTIVERRGLEDLRQMTEELEMPSPFAETLSGAQAREGRAAVRTARGDRAGALDDLRVAAGILEPLRIGPRFSPWRSRLALSLPAEDADEAVALAREELEMARVLGSPRAEGIALRTIGVLTGGEHGTALLHESVAVLADDGLQYERARSLTELGMRMRRDQRRAAGRDTLRAAASLARACGAERLEELALEELSIAGARRRSGVASGHASLTPSEHRIAVAAAKGATNKDIAQRLFLSLSTVETHLTSVYRKLSISSRSELAAALSNFATETP
jgi:DNA-binding CsgD family transcriptional regulator